MGNEKSYLALIHERIFIGGASDAPSMAEEEQCDVIVDLRAEAEDGESIPGIRRVRAPLVDKSTAPNQETAIQEAVEKVVAEYKAGHKVGFHCAAGRERTGAVAAGVLLSLGICSDVDEAEAQIQSIRDAVKINPIHKQALKNLYPKK
ncbi:hypothetical protein QJ48_31780 [Paenibacillus sp. A3]|uniref:protein-tyrosine phosphatase family protein n=1 Tax=Paenibacillus sp. A3 TaxID=1337054 RepID=UPI0006D54CB6|nr:dual specificity protein phosphatase family protein [Paenibacillus sp. A3]KPV55703.1 hypothetical protein QJ48_31780 [Paenibacillus sp. A3]